MWQFLCIFRYFSLQATRSLRFEDQIRKEVENNMSREDGRLHDCFTTPRSIVYGYIELVCVDINISISYTHTFILCLRMCSSLLPLCVTHTKCRHQTCKQCFRAPAALDMPPLKRVYKAFQLYAVLSKSIVGTFSMRNRGRCRCQHKFASVEGSRTFTTTGTLTAYAE